jgi:hypothetical protein
MKSMADNTLAFKKVSLGLVRTRLVTTRLVKAASFAVVACVLALAQSSPQIHLPQANLPEVHLDADGLTPRPIEELTGTTIARHYALAWRDLAMALESGQAGGLGEEFVGFAKDHLMKRITEQNQTGMHVRIVDHGHHLKAVFYSTDGSAMQLLDQAQLEVQTFDGNKLLDTQNVLHEYMVLMTPGADRWYVRDLEEVSAKPF